MLLSSEVESNREADYKINPIFLNRWSPRSFQDKEIPEDVLFSVFEAARWAPSSSNQQPWRYIIARTKEDREQFHEFINPGNREWCERAPVLALLFSYKLSQNGNDNPSHAFDTGTAWGYLALQAMLSGLITHAMGGFDKAKAREALNVPEDYELHAVLALGYRGEKEALSEKNQASEKPNGRKSMDQFMYESTYGKGLSTN